MNASHSLRKILLDDVVPVMKRRMFVMDYVGVSGSKQPTQIDPVWVSRNKIESQQRYLRKGIE
jgi:hypothetical protein